MDKRLMVGDWVRVTTNKGKKKDVQINYVDVDGCIIYNGGMTYDYQLIPINDDYLVDVGFIDHQLIGDTERWILKDDAGNRIIAMDWYGTYYECIYKVGRNIGKIDIQYISQFQHLCSLLEIPLTPIIYE